MSRITIIAIAALVGLATTTPSLARTHHPRIMTYGTYYEPGPTNFAGVKSRRGPDTARTVYRNPDRGLPVPCHGSNC